MKSLTIRGFENQEQVQAFVDWYEGSGEQSIPIWLECGKTGIAYMDVDMKSIKDTPDGMEFSIKPIKP